MRITVSFFVAVIFAAIVVADGSANALCRLFVSFVKRFYGLVADSRLDGPHDGARKQITHILDEARVGYVRLWVSSRPAAQLSGRPIQLRQSRH